MIIGGLGYLSFVLTSILIWKPNKLLFTAIFFASFCASSVISFSSFFLQPGHYFFILFLGVSTVWIMSKEIKRVTVVYPNLLLFAFVIVAFLSIIISWALKIDVLVYGIGNNNQLKSSLVSRQNFTQFLYLVMGFIMYWCVYNYCCKGFSQWKYVVRICGLSGCVVLLIGVYQIIAHTLGLPFDEIFRNSVKDMWQTKERVQATMGEASFLGQYCIYLAAIFAGGYKWCSNRLVRMASLALLMVIGVLTRSTTFLLGAFALFFSYGLFQRKTAKNVLKYMFIVIIGALAIVYLLQYNAKVQLMFNSAISKFNLQSYSGIERSTIFSYMLKVGLNYPILGIGYGGGRSTDLYANILSNTGFVGFVIFASFIIREFIILIKDKDSEGVQMCLLLLIGFLVTSWSMPDISYLPFWVIMAIIDSRCYYCRHHKRERGYDPPILK
ncbi:O-antigen ligase family protein [Lacrimispora sp.]|uniref:O-antigen ligase family protein n=1 Tax=Lacrimispora sp. TaxID=2719234 RepID=UPI00345F6D1B